MGPNASRRLILFQLPTILLVDYNELKYLLRIAYFLDNKALIHVKELEKLINEISELERLRWKDPRYQAWLRKVLRFLKNKFGETSDYYKDFFDISHPSFVIGVGTPDRVFQSRYQEDLKKYKIHLQSFREEIKGENKTTILPPNSGTKSKIWVLGSNNPNADKSVGWNDQFPNFTDPDVVIVNLQSLNKDVINRINKDEYKLARDLMWDRFVQGNTLIFITAHHAEIISSYINDEPLYIETIRQQNGNERHSTVDFPIDYICPLKLNTIDVPQGSIIIYATDHPYAEYLKAVKKYDFFYELGYTSLSIFQGLTLSDLKKDDYRAIEAYKITDKSRHSLGISGSEAE